MLCFIIGEGGECLQIYYTSHTLETGSEQSLNIYRTMLQLADMFSLRNAALKGFY